MQFMFDDFFIEKIRSKQEQNMSTIKIGSEVRDVFYRWRKMLFFVKRNYSRAALIDPMNQYHVTRASTIGEMHQHCFFLIVDFT